VTEMHRESRVARGLRAAVATLVLAGAAVRAAPPDAGTVRLDAATRERIGLAVAPLGAAHVQLEVRGFGHVLDPALLAQPVYDLEAARVAADTARREYARTQRLARGDANASRRDVENARAASAQAEAALRTARARLVATWGPQAAAREGLLALARTLVAREATVARIDLPLGTPVEGSPATGRLRPLAEPSADPLEATVLGVAPDVDPTVQGRGFMLLAPHASWTPGTAVDGWLELPGAPRAGVVVPRPALVRHAGDTWVYVQTDDGVFVRRRVHVERPVGGGWFVADAGLAPGDPVVVTGAQTLLSTELGGPVEED
jgi:multidrug efflux pump subunit AcrA (membrane-fusion protein)